VVRGITGRPAGRRFYDPSVSCSRTYATLRLLHEELDPDLITSRLGLHPTRTFRTGEPMGHGSMTPHRQGGWFLSTTDCDSVDVRVHVAHLLDQVESVGPVLQEIRQEDVRQDVTCFWQTTDGQGGPALDSAQMGRLANLDLSISFDVYNIRQIEPE